MELKEDVMGYVVAGITVVGLVAYVFLASIFNDAACATITRSSLPFKLAHQLLAACFV